ETGIETAALRRRTAPATADVPFDAEGAGPPAAWVPAAATPLAGDAVAVPGSVVVVEVVVGGTGRSTAGAETVGNGSGGAGIVGTTSPAAAGSWTPSASPIAATGASQAACRSCCSRLLLGWIGAFTGLSLSGVRTPWCSSHRRPLRCQRRSLEGGIRPQKETEGLTRCEARISCKLAFFRPPATRPGERGRVSRGRSRTGGTIR